MPAARASTHALGSLGERIARTHLEGAGMRVLAQNVKTQRGEIDLVALDGTTLVFVEVKTRRASTPRSAGEADPLEGIRARKRARLRGAGAAWLSEHREHPFARRIRFDAVAVSIDAAGGVRSLTHVCDAF